MRGQIQYDRIKKAYDKLMSSEDFPVDITSFLGETTEINILKGRYIIYGTWIRSFLLALDDICQESKKLSENSSLTPCRSSSLTRRAKDTSTFFRAHRSNSEWYSQLRSDVFSVISYNQFLNDNLYQYNTKQTSSTPSKAYPTSNPASLRNAMFHSIAVINKLVRNMQKVYNYDLFTTPLRSSDLQARSLGKLNFLYRKTKSYNKYQRYLARLSYNDDFRFRTSSPMSHKSNKNETDLLVFLVKILFESYVPASISQKGIPATSDIVNRYFPSKATTIRCASSYYSDDVFKVYLATQLFARTIHLEIIQHGGGFFMSSINDEEEHMLKIADKIYTWGAKSVVPMSGNNKNNSLIQIVPLPYAKREVRYVHKVDGILLVLNEWPIIDYRYFVTPFADGQKKNLIQLYELIRRLQKINLPIAIRVHKTGRIQLRHEIIERFPNIDFIDRENTSYSENIQNMNYIHVHTADSTSFLQSIKANIPTLLMLGEEFNLISGEHRVILEEMRGTIFHQSPNDLSATVNMMLTSLKSTWYSTSWQKARRSMELYFASPLIY